MTINSSLCGPFDSRLPGKGLNPWSKDHARTIIAAWKQTVQLSNPVCYPPNTLIYDQKSTCHDAFLLEQGLIALDREQRASGRSGIFALCFPGYLFGYPPFEVEHLYRHSAIALTHCVVHSINLEKLLVVLGRGGDNAISVIRLYLQNLLCSQVRSTELATQDARQRFEQLLIELASVLEDKNSTGFIKLPLMDKEIASLLGISPERFSVIKKQMTEDKVITSFQQKKRFVMKSSLGTVKFYKSHYSQMMGRTA